MTVIWIDSGRFSAEPWTPTGANVWHSAGDPSTLTIVNGAASQLNDKIGNVHLIQDVATQRPAVITNGLNGKTVLTLDGVDDYMTSANAGLPMDISIIALMKFNSATSYDVMLSFGVDQQSSAIRGIFRNTGSTTMGFTTWGNDIDSSSISCDIGGDFHIFTAIQSGQQVFMWRDGTPDTVLPRLLRLPPMQVQTSRYTLGTLFGPYISSWFSAITFCEAVVYYSAINSTLRQQTEGYVAHEWVKQSNLASDHPYKNTRPYV
jgi:hypothetical protein